MKGITYDCKTGKVREIEDGLPMPTPPPFIEPVGLNLAEAATKLKEIDQLKADVAALKVIVAKIK
jgi:hypothetical protein